MLREPVKARQIQVEIFQDSDRVKLQGEVNHWLNSHQDTLVYNILYKYNQIISNPSDSLSQHYRQGYSMAIIYGTPIIKS